jgi:RHS repeat-associated protein
VTAVKARYDYDPYGKRIVLSEIQVADLGFTGQFSHGASALALAPFRAFEPSIGRWISEDPVGTVDGLNRYYYSRNNPISNRDVTGLFTIASSCSPSERSQIRAAVEAVKKKICSQPSEWCKGGPSCLPSGASSAKFCEALENTTFHCVKSDLFGFFMQGSKCAGAIKPGTGVTGRDVTFFTQAFTSSTLCGCLEGNVLHEISHFPTLGYGHTPPNHAGELAKGCFPCHKYGN